MAGVARRCMTLRRRLAHQTLLQAIFRRICGGSAENNLLAANGASGYLVEPVQFPPLSPVRSVHRCVVDCKYNLINGFPLSRFHVHPKLPVNIPAIAPSP